MKVQIVNKSAYETPFYATEKSAGMDLKANITEPVTLGPLERALIPTGLFIAGYYHLSDSFTWIHHERLI